MVINRLLRLSNHPKRLAQDMILFLFLFSGTSVERGVERVWNKCMLLFSSDNSKSVHANLSCILRSDPHIKFACQDSNGSMLSSRRQSYPLGVEAVAAARLFEVAL